MDTTAVTWPAHGSDGAQRHGEPVAAADGHDPRRAGGHLATSRWHDRGAEAAAAQQLGHGLGDGHRPVPTAGAAEGQRQVRLALLHVGRQQEPEQAVEAVEEGTAPRAGSST